MAKSKSLKAAYAKFDTEKLYTISEAVKLMKSCNMVKFDATAEAHFNLGIDPRHAEQQIRTTFSLPHGTGKSTRVVVFCEDDVASSVKAAGAVEAGGSDLIDKVSKGWFDFDVAVATPGMMKELAKIARVLGPKGMMPSPKAGTVSPDPVKTVKELVAGRMELRNEKNGIIHSVFGKLSFDDKKLEENLQALFQVVKDNKPSAVKGIYIKTFSVNSTMGAGIKVQITEPTEQSK